jgi:hypothetical protein
MPKISDAVRYVEQVCPCCYIRLEPNHSLTQSTQPQSTIAATDLGLLEPGKPVVAVFDPDGKKMTEMHSPNGLEGPERVSAVSETSGDYRLEVRSTNSKADKGRYVARIAELRAGAVQDKTCVAAERAYGEGLQLSGGDTASKKNAIEKFDETVRLSRAAEAPELEGSSLDLSGYVCHLLNDRQKALEFYEQAAAVQERSGDRPWARGEQAQQRERNEQLTRRLADQSAMANEKARQLEDVKGQLSQRDLEIQGSRREIRTGGETRPPRSLSLLWLLRGEGNVQIFCAYPGEFALSGWKPILARPLVYKIPTVIA